MYPARDLYTVVVPPADQIDGGVESGIVLIHGLTGFMMPVVVAAWLWHTSWRP